jgi:2-hydroxy-3-oxopropionate reductase
LSKKTAFLGTGLMGCPMALNLIADGHDLTVWNRTRSKTEPLEQRGAKVADTPAEAVADVDRVCVILENGPVVDQVLFAQGTADNLQPGALVVDFSSIPPETATDHAGRLTERGVEHLDAPVSGGPYGAEAGTLAIMVGGTPEAFERGRAIMELFGTPTHVGPSGCGQVAKLGSQTIVAAAIAAVSEALLLARARGADPAKVREALSGGFADSKILQIHAKRMIERDFLPGGHVRTHSKDLDAAFRVAEHEKLDLPMLEFVHGMFHDLCDAGLGDHDHSALVLAVEARNSPLRLAEGTDKVPD